MNTHLKEKIRSEDEVREIKLACNICLRRCEMILLLEGLSVITVKDDGCKKGSKFAYREMKKQRKLQSLNALNGSGMD